MKPNAVFSGLFLCSLLFPCTVQAQQQARIELFSPQGTVKGVNQVRARFSEAMVPFGDPRVVVEPFRISCPAKGSARWADTRNWVYDFAEGLPAGVRCEFNVREGLKTIGGREIGGPRGFVFSTGGPAITSSEPFEGSTIEEDQAFFLRLDGDATEESVLSNVYFVVEGISSRVGFRVLPDKDRETILKTQFQHQEDELKGYLANKRRFPLIQAKQRFPAGANVSLVWGEGISSPGGVATDKDQVLAFVTRTPFTAFFHCQKENPQAECVPITPMRVSFSAPVLRSQAGKIVLKGAKGRKWASTIADEEGQNDQHVSGVSFKGPFPEKSSFTIEIPPGLKDDSGRALSNADKFPMSVKTDEYPPLAKFAADFGILELRANPMLPVTLRNVEPEVSARMFEVTGGEGNADPPKPVQEGQGVAGNMRGKILKVPADRASQMLSWISKVKERGYEDRDKSIFGPVTGEKARKFSIPKLQGSKSFDVVGIPFKAPGFYVVEIESELLGAALLGETKPMYVPTTVLVTGLSVHFKWGGDSSLVWVTRLDDAKPVDQAAVQIRNCEGALLWQGKTDTDGLARIQKLPAGTGQRSCSYDRFGSGLLVTAQLAEDMAFLHTSWDEGIEPWRFRLPTEYERRFVLAHTVFDRTLFRAGEVVHMKHYLRKHETAGFSLPIPSDYGKSVTIQHMGSEQKYELPVKWDSDGIAETTWTIPKEAKLGEYSVLLGKLAKGELHPPSGEFRVEEFRVPLMKGVIRPPAEALVSPANIPIDLTVSYLAGGGAGSLPIRFRYDVHRSLTAPLDGFEDFSFSEGKVHEGLVRGDPDIEEKERFEVKSTDMTLDKSGSARTAIAGLRKVERPMEVLAELEFRDPNGEVQTVSSRIPLWPADRHVGIRPESWTLSKESLRFQVAVVDLKGKPVANAPVRVDLLQRKIYSHRKRLVGGFYAYEHSTETKRIRALCEGRTDKRGLLFCDKPSPISGNVILQAVAQDSAGREIATHRDAWIAGRGEMWFRAEDGDRIDVIPEAKRYEPGDQARLQVRMPFRNATALVTVEREGVAESFVKELSGREPVVELPVKGNYAPNVFISVLVLRGRVTDVQPTATIDLGRPAYKLGIAEINVGWKAHELKVKVTSDRPFYRVREKARVTIAVTTSEGKPPAKGAEVAVAAVDEGLLELMPNRSWQLLDAMMGRRRYGVQTSTAQMHVVGKRHFGLKALPQGGGGGRQITRELLETLLLWQGRIRLNERGTAAVEVPLNDSLTSFRIVAVANSGAGRFGTGSASIRSTQDLMIFSGIAPVVRQGDKFRAEFTLRNTTERPMEVRASAQIKALAEPLASVTLSLAPGESRQIGWNITAPAGLDSLRYEMEATGGEGIVDRLSVTQKVVAPVPVRAFQATLAQVEGELHVDVERPGDAIAGRGGIQVSLRPSLVNGLTGVTDYMGTYPYTCLEQSVSKAVVLRDTPLWNKVMTQLPSYLDEDGLAKYFPSMRQGSDTLTSYLLAIIHEVGWQIPDNPKAKMLWGLKGFVEGKVVRYSSLPTADLAIRKLAAIEALSRYGEELPPRRQRSERGDLAAQIREDSRKVDASLLSSVAIEPNLWPTSAIIDWANILRRIPSIRSREQRIAEAEQILRSRLNFQGTTIGFSTESADFLSWLMVSIDTNAVRLLLTQMDSAAWKEDIPRLVRGALGRQRRGSWDTTVANAWGMLAMDRFSRSFERTPVTGTSHVSLAGITQTVDWNASPAGRALSFDWPARQSPLAISTAGTGNPWATVQSLAAIPLRQPLSAGFNIKKTLTPVEQKEQGAWSKGDIVRVKLDIEAQADMTWVVVSDPIPAGAAIFGTGLGRDSQLATKGEERKGWVWPAFEERSFEAFRSYYDFVPKGSWTIEYTVRLNSEGLMNLPTTRVEALYAPEMFGEIPNDPMRIR